jgi:hypothetical protein
VTIAQPSGWCDEAERERETPTQNVASPLRNSSKVSHFEGWSPYSEKYDSMVSAPSGDSAATSTRRPDAPRKP